MPVQQGSKLEISQYILEHIPREAEVTRIEYEGPAIALYTRRPEILIEQSSIITDIVSIIRKRIVIRSDPEVRLSERQTQKIIKEIVPPEAEITNVNFDPSLGEVIIEAKKPGLEAAAKHSTRNTSKTSRE